MGTLVGHVAPGFGFFLIGLWHLVNHIKLHAARPRSYKSPPWFATSRLRYAELLAIMASCCASVAMELFIGPSRHQPLDRDWTIPSNHLHNFEHSLISISFFTYAAFAVVLDRALTGPNEAKAKNGLTQLIGAVAFGQQLLLFHLHSADHMGVEGQYHLLLQAVIVVSLATTLLGIGLPRSFLISFVRSASILFQGVWLVIMGFTLWTPGLIPKGCFLNLEEGHDVVRCHSDEALHRAKSLVNIGFGWFLILITAFSVGLYLALVKIYGEAVEYRSLTKTTDLEEEDDDDGGGESDDVESQKKITSGEPKSFIDLGNSKTFPPMDIER
ncbi:transmembrane protein 45B-like [Rhodamnia argentea]|uniref:Transmembrane protein 45B-like n=1 Tax=Rhodamnia argentea TaxID=178133 RepID=A0A8B8QKI0_9MYRT|nr:transmembrane protein 45B-like [Rhodamnia argentea]